MSAPKFTNSTDFKILLKWPKVRNKMSNEVGKHEEIQMQAITISCEAAAAQPSR